MVNDVQTQSSPSIRPRRRPLWLLAVPVALYLLTPLIANTIQPVVLGMPFIVFYTVGVTILTWAFIWLTASLDPLYKGDADEPVPADLVFGDAAAGQATRDLEHAARTEAPRP
ncbi:MAG: DUF3311 domain-containing protein [Rhodanobacteraceae bacterium]